MCMVAQTQSHQEAWREYERALSDLSDEIVADVPQDGTLNGYEWCDEKNVPETMFAHAVNYSSERLEYGVSPMIPWRIP